MNSICEDEIYSSNDDKFIQGQFGKETISLPQENSFKTQESRPYTLSARECVR